MSSQRHIIKRQVLELEIADPANAQDVQARFSQLYRQQIMPLIEHYCDQLSTPDQIHRIDALEIDLGQLDPDQPEHDFVRRVDAALHDALSRQIAALERESAGMAASVRQQSAYELVNLFLQTGSLPWWADLRDRAVIATAYDALLSVQPDALRALLRSFAGDERPFLRLAKHIDDIVLLRTLHLLLPVTQTITQADVRRLLDVLMQPELRPALIRRKLLQAAAESMANTATLTHYLRAVLHALPVSDSAALKVQMRDDLPQNSVWQQALTIDEAGAVSDATPFEPAPQAREHLATIRALLPQLDASLADLHTLRAQLSAHIPPRTEAKRLSELASHLYSIRAVLRILRALLAQYRVLDKPLSALNACLHDLQTLLIAFSAEVLSVTQPDDAAHKMLSSADVRQLATAFSQNLREILRTAPIRLRDLRQWRRDLNRATRSTAEERAQLLKTLDEAIHEARQRHHQGVNKAPDVDFEDVTIQNAGLVIVWPFLSHFFGRLNLLDDGQFRDDTAQAHAVQLLQYIATGHNDDDLQEYDLLLNKVLCGVDLVDTLEFDEALSDDHIEACDNLLQAIIMQASILKQMSNDGLRGTFLLREGMLSERDGAWLLRVEREAYDIVLDQFPWSWGWVKLPWMDTALRVEW